MDKRNDSHRFADCAYVCMFIRVIIEWCIFSSLWNEKWIDKFVAFIILMLTEWAKQLLSCLRLVLSMQWNMPKWENFRNPFIMNVTFACNVHKNFALDPILNYSGRYLMQVDLSFSAYIAAFIIIILTSRKWQPMHCTHSSYIHCVYQMHSTNALCAHLPHATIFDAHFISLRNSPYFFFLAPRQHTKVRINEWKVRSFSYYENMSLSV